MLRHVGGQSTTEIAKTLKKEEEEVGHILEQARAYLRQRLVDSNCRFREAA